MRKGHSRQHLRSLAAGAASIKAAKALLPAPPAAYEPNTFYRVQLKKSILLDDGTWMRPSDDVILVGSLAAKFASSISAAQAQT